MLRELGVAVDSIEDLPPAGELPRFEISLRIQRASFVLGILAGEHSASSSVLFEIGVAVGLGKPVFLITEREDLASSVASLPLVVAPVNEVSAIRFHIDAFVASLAHPQLPPTLKKPPRFYGGGAVLVAPHHGGVSSERRVEEALRRTGASVTVSAKAAATEADMIVWLPESDLGVSGPLLVEVKEQATEAFPQRATDQLLRLLADFHLRAALLVTNAKEQGITGRVTDGTHLYSVSLVELERLTRSGGLFSELRRVRNRLAHGLT